MKSSLVIVVLTAVLKGLTDKKEKVELEAYQRKRLTTECRCDFKATEYSADIETSTWGQ
jgi:hypothetical protein